MTAKRIVIVGGVAGGMSCAARARRLSEEASITVIERGPHVSFANCGLPYHLGGEIPDIGKLIVQTPEKLHAHLNLEIRSRTTATAINREAKTVSIRTAEGAEQELPYDALVLSPGAAPLRPPIEGIGRAGHFTLRNIPDLEAISDWIRASSARHAVIIGGGYIGLETAEQLVRRGLSVAVAEALPQVMAPLDPDMATYIHDTLRGHGIKLFLGDGVASFQPPAEGEQAAASVVVLQSGKRLRADIVILGMGVRPEVNLARDAGLVIGERGGIRTDDHMRTSDPAIYAVGDAAEVRDAVTGEYTVIPLAGPANRQGRIVADNIFGRPSTYPGTLGTALLRVFDMVAGIAGASEKALRRAGIAYKVVHLHPNSHAGYYPGAQPIALKLVFSPEDGKILGIQAVGTDGVDKRVDVVATAMRAGMTVDDLAELELGYAPPFGSAKDPVNLAGMAAQNILAGLVESITVEELAAEPNRDDVRLVDVRDSAEVAQGALPASVHIPLGELRARLAELPRDKVIVVHCQTGQRSYYAARVLAQHGFKVKNLSGSYKTWKQSAATS